MIDGHLGYNAPMSLDKELYRLAHEHYRQWNLAERADRAHHAGERTPEEGWKTYVAWWEFLMRIAPERSQVQLDRRLDDWSAYYSRMQKIEQWRKDHGY
jgi:hypothetical protein